MTEQEWELHTLKLATLQYMFHKGVERKEKVQDTKRSHYSCGILNLSSLLTPSQAVFTLGCTNCEIICHVNSIGHEKQVIINNSISCIPSLMHVLMIIRITSFSLGQSLHEHFMLSHAWMQFSLTVILYTVFFLSNDTDRAEMISRLIN